MVINLRGGLVGFPLHQFSKLVDRLNQKQIHLLLDEIKADSLIGLFDTDEYQLYIISDSVHFDFRSKTIHSPLILLAESYYSLDFPGIVCKNDEDLFYAISGLTAGYLGKLADLQDKQISISILESLRDACAIAGTDARIIHTNRKFEEIFTTTINGGFSGRYISDLFSESETTIVAEMASESVKDKSIQARFLYSRGDHTQSNRILVICIQLDAESGGLPGTLWLFRRVPENIHPPAVFSSETTDSMDTFEALLANGVPLSIPADVSRLNPDLHSQLVNWMLETTPDIVAYTDVNHHIRYLNKAGMDRFGITEHDDIYHMSPLIFFPPEDQINMVNCVLPEAKAKGISSGENRMVDKNGTPFPVSYVVQYQKAADYGFYYSLAARDISMDKERENQLFEAKQLYENLADASKIVVIVISREGVVTYINKYASNMFGYLPQDVLGTNIMDVITAHTHQISNNLPSVFENGQPVYIEDLIEVEKINHWVGAWLVPVKNEENQVVSVMSLINDISKEKESEFNLIQALEKEREYNELQSRFATMISHEFKTPLSTILSSLEILQTYADQLPVDKKEIHYKRMKNSVSLLNSYLDDILVLGRIKEHQLSLHPIWIDIVEFCQNLVEESMWNDKTGHIIKYVVIGENHKVLLDPDMIRHILDNVLNNAIKYSDPNSRIVFTLDNNATRQVFTIQDEGIGLSNEDLEHVFEPFFRSSQQKATPGTGLGLPIVKRAVELLNGSVDIQSTLGQGTQVRIIIPNTSGSMGYDTNTGN